jgi:hypothetical protein
MSAKASSPEIDALFGDRTSASRAVYDALLAAMRGLGPVEVEPKKTCVHLVAERDGTAFAGIHPRKNGILLTLRTETAITSPRVRKTEQASRNRRRVRAREVGVYESGSAAAVGSASRACSSA